MRLRILAVAAVIVGVVAGCSGNGADNKPSTGSQTAAPASTAKPAALYTDVIDASGSGYSVKLPKGWKDQTEKYQHDFPDAKFDLFATWPSLRPNSPINESFSVLLEDSATCQDVVCKATRRLGGWNEKVLSDIEARKDEMAGKSVTATRVRSRLTVDGEPAVWLSKDSPNAAIESVLTFHNGTLVMPTLKLPTDSPAEYRDAAFTQILQSLKWPSK